MTSQRPKQRRNADTDKPTLDARAISQMKDGARREKMVLEFHRGNYDLYRRVAIRFRTRAGVSPNDVDDLTQIVAMVSDAIIRDPKLWAEGRYLFFAALLERSRSKLRDWSFSSEHTGIGAGSGARRRQMYVAQVRARLSDELGREPTGPELIRASHEEMEKRRSNPSKGGRITERDIEGMRIMPSELDVDLIGGYGGAVLPGDCDLDPTEMRPLAEKVIAECEATSDKLGLVASAYLGQFLSDPALEEPTFAEIAEVVGRSTDWVRRSVHEVRRVARDVLAEDYGITGNSTF